jgi:hypothetical protein
VRATLEAIDGLAQWSDMTNLNPAQMAALDAFEKQFAQQQVRALSDDDRHIADNLIAAAQGALPRYAGQTHRLHLDDIPALAAMVDTTSMEQLATSVHPAGLWLTWRWTKMVTLPDPVKTIWWSPDLPHATATPLGLAGLWCHIHLLLAALWHDLCANETTLFLIEHPLDAHPPTRYQTRLMFGAGAQVRQQAERIAQAGVVIGPASPFA